MGVFVSDLHVFENEDGEFTFLGAIIASDEDPKALSAFMSRLRDIKRDDSRIKPSPVSTDAFFRPSEAISYFVITPKCRRLAIELGAQQTSLSLLINKCRNGTFTDAWEEIYPFCI